MDLVLEAEYATGLETGIELLRWIQRNLGRESIQIVVISKFLTDDLKAQIMEYGALPVDKSSPPSQIIELLNKAVSEALQRGDHVYNVTSRKTPPREIHPDWYSQ